MKAWDVEDTDCEKIKEYLAFLIERLDELDGDDYFGPEGWRQFIMRED